MFNLTVLQGRICQDLELKQTQNGNMVTSFSIAVDRAYRKGEEKQTDFIPVVVWGKQAEIVTKYFKKGYPIGITGSMNSRSYEKEDGSKQTVLSLLYKILYPERKTIMKKAIKKAFENQINGVGFSLIEVVSTCPTNWGLTPEAALQFVEEKMIPYYPLGVYKDRSAKEETK